MITLVTGGLLGPLVLTGGLLPAPPPASAVSTFPKPANYNDLLPPIVLSVPHAAGAATLVLPTGAGARLGTLPANRIFRVTALRNPNTTAEVVLGIFDATGIDIPGDTLTGVSGDEGFGNVALPAGTTIEVRWTAKDLGEIQDAVNALEATAWTPPTLADAAAAAGSVYLGSDHLDGAGAPKLCRKSSAGIVTVLG
jgi:hypothetical protein